MAISIPSNWNRPREARFNKQKATFAPGLTTATQGKFTPERSGVLLNRELSPT